MRKVIFGLLLALIPAPAFANCPSGNCGVEINCMTGVETYYDIQPEIVFDPVIEQQLTITISVTTENSNLSITSTQEGVTQAVRSLSQIQLPTPEVQVANEIIFDISSGQVTVQPLTSQQIQQNLDIQRESAIRQAELASQAYLALELENDWWINFLKELEAFDSWFFTFNWEGIGL